MNEKQEQMDFKSWFSTYGLLTADRVLERFNIHLPHEKLIQSANDPRCVYFKLLRVPLKNVFNGIILQQAHDYQVYAQKLFIDYLLSGEDAKEKDAPGANTREDIEHQRLKLLELGEEFHRQEASHQVLIADSQACLIELSRDLKKLLNMDAENPDVIEQSLATFIEQAEDLNINLRSYRSQFYNLILRVTELLKLLPEYRIDLEKEADNRESLEFDALIGEE